MDNSSCAETKLSEHSSISKKQWVLLYAAAALVLFFRIGTGDINGSEGRWLSVADEMLRSGDWFHPTINGQPYFDKPLLSYWFIALLSKLVGGVSEWTARIPSAAAALLTLTAVISIARRLFSPTAALAAGWVLTATYSFVYWGRLAEADMWNAAFIVAATAWYLRFREKRSLVGYAVFWGLCAAGAQTKGLAAAIIPAAAAGTDMLLNRRLKFHCNLKSWFGLLCGILLYAGYSVSVPVLQNIVAAQADPAQKNLVMGFYNATKSLGSIIGSLVAGFIYGIHVKLPFICVAVVYGLSIIAALGYLLYCRRKVET